MTAHVRAALALLLLAPACDASTDAPAPPTATTARITVPLTGAPPAGGVVWDLAVAPGAPDSVFARAERHLDGLGHGAPALTLTTGCDPRPEAQPHRVTATLVGFSVSRSMDRAALGAPGTAPPGGLVPALAPLPTVTTTFTCTAGAEVDVTLDAAVAPGTFDFFPTPVIVSGADWQLSPSLACTFEDNGRVRLALGLALGRSAFAAYDPELVLDDLVLSCAGLPDLSLSPLADAQVGPASVSVSRTAAPHPLGDLATWQVLLDLDEAHLAAHDCQLSTRGTACHAPSPPGVLAAHEARCADRTITAGQVHVVLAWHATLSAGGDVRCYPRDLTTDGLSFVMTSTLSTADTVFAHAWAPFDAAP